MTEHLVNIFLIFTLLFGFITLNSSLKFQNSGYKNIVISIEDSVPVENCLQIIKKLEVK